MSTSLLSILNMALNELGKPAVSSIDENQQAQVFSSRIIDFAPHILLEANWNFAVIYRSDNTPLVEPFSPDFPYAYQLPGDFGKFISWLAGSIQPYKYSITDGMLLTIIKPAQYYYLSNQVNFENWPPLVAYTLALYAAASLAFVTTNNAQLTAYLEKKYERTLAKAVVNNVMNGPIVSQPYNDFDRVQYV